MTHSIPTVTADERAEPVWEIATLFPNQGQWSEEEYLALETNRLVEFSHGYVEVLPVPTDRHQAILLFLSTVLLRLRRRHGGTVRTAGLRVRLWEGKYREPDLVYVLPEHDHWRHERFWNGADLVMEIVSHSPDDRRRDLVTKRQEYARAGIPEYWIVDSETETIAVLRLEGKEYVEHGVFRRGQTAASAHFPDLTTAVSAVFDAD